MKTTTKAKPSDLRNRLQHKTMSFEYWDQPFQRITTAQQLPYARWVDKLRKCVAWTTCTRQCPATMWHRKPTEH
jgi:succinate dehydrogenase/fumarate reductase-like Fe-S protein